MPFLDHLEELRSRILRSLAAVILGSGIGLWAVQHFQLVNLLKRPIAPYLTDGKLVVLSPTEPVMIVLKLGFLLGLVLASPIILWQTWAFLAPALYAREKRALVPSLFIGLLLFLGGVALAYLFVVPQALRVLFSFQTEAIAPFITYDKYFSFVMQVTMALGISFELPLVIIILSWLGVIGPSDLSRFRRFAVVLAFIAGAVLSPGADLLSMVMMTVPLLLLYEIGFAGSVVISRRRAKARLAGGTIGLILLLSLTGTTAEAQVPAGQRRPLTRADSLRDSTRLARDSVPAPGQSLDTATARRLGLPTAPSRTFAEPDSIVTDLLGRSGYQATRYSADSATVFVQDQRVFLQGKALTERRGSTLEADTITYRSASCLLDASGEPKLFDRGQVMVGQGIRYDTCVRRGVITDALTNFTEGSTVWFLRGDVSQDSSSNRIYAASSEITSCDLPVPHYHFSARQVKWVSKSVLVARPVVLYVRDVPILWLPFIFQDMRPGRHSGILVPQFGFNDLVRPNRSYNRQVTNIGYYWAPSDYIDLTGRLDWYSNRYLQYGIGGQYNWLNRFVSGSVAYSKQQQTGGGSSMTLRWDHQQTFDLSTSLNLDLNYASNTTILERNAIDPLLNTKQITSSVNFSKRYGWGTVTLGGNRRQSLSDGSVQQLLPALTVSPASIDLGSNITWSPGLSLTNNTSSRTPLNPIEVISPGGLLDTLEQTGSSRETSFNLDTPFRFGSFNWQNSIDVTDQRSTGRDQVPPFRVDDPSTPDPTDSVTVFRSFLGDFSTGVDWNTGINLPVLFRGSWKIQPALGIANTTSGPFALRNRNTGGDFVRQGKRFRFSATASPTLFAFFPGFGIASRIRHSLSPTFSWSYSPAASVPEEYARAIAGAGQPFQLRSDATQTVSMTLSQAIEGKAKTKRGETETEGVEPRKFRVLSINTSAISYDFEQAKKPGRTGWATETITNSFLSDLLSQFTLSLTHDLWDGPVGFEGSRFDPFLSSVSASFAVTGNTFRSIGSIFGLGGSPRAQPESNEVPDPAEDERLRRNSFYNSGMEPFSGGRSFSANFDYSLSRTRPAPNVVQRNDQSLRFNTNFSPTPFWSLSWGSLYNITDSKFESQSVRLERQLHEWRAGFNFLRNANGNFAFYFSIYLTDLPDLKFDYNQTTFER